MLSFNYKKITSIAIIDSIDGYVKASRHKPDLFVTDNVLLYEKIKSTLSKNIINSDINITQKDINNWGNLFTTWGLYLDKELNSIASQDKMYKCIQEAGHISTFLLALISRLIGLLRAINIKKLKKVIIVYSDNKKWHKSQKHNRFISPYPFLSKNKFFGKAHVILERIEVNYIEHLSESKTDSLFLRIFSASILDNIIWKIINNKYFNFSQSVTVVKGDSEVIRESLSKLVFKGILPIAYHNIILKKNIRSCQSILKVKDVVNNLLKEKINKNFSFNKNQNNALLEIIILDLQKKLTFARENSIEIDSFFNQINKKYTKIRSIIVSSPNATTAKYLHKVAKKNQIKVINFEHGLTTGISMRNKNYMNYSEATNCDYMMVINELAKKDYELNKKNNIANLNIVGLPNQIKNVKNKKIINFYIRRKYAFKKNDFCICHVSTLLFNGGIRFGTDTLTDYNVNNFNYKILKKVYNNIYKKKIIFKDYPSVRHVYQPKLKDRVNIENKNIFFEESGDWRYIRAISDLIVTMSFTSTFSWCVGAKVPIVFIHIPHIRLRHEWLHEGFINSFFYFDTSNKNWTAELRLLLNKPKKDIYKLWEEKKEYRDTFINKYLYSNKKNIFPIKKMYKLLT